MFDTIQSIWVAMREFQKKTNKRPNILFVDRRYRVQFMKMVWEESKNEAEEIL